MTPNHRHDMPARATAEPPTLSLLRLSAAERALGAGALLALLWLLVFWVLN
jgi:hypothetical protein